MTMQLTEIALQPCISTDRLDLRPLRKSDIGMIGHYSSDERVARQTSSIPHPLPPMATEAFVARAMSSTSEEDVWAIDAREQGGSDLMGLIALRPIERQQSEVGYWIAPPFWNTGLASEALRALVEANPNKDKTMFGSVFQDNPASARVLIHCGFEYLGDAESFSVARDALVPTWTYSRKL